ncbi:isoleucine--tRNA ligase [Lachnospiraceae bacterium NSJ-143]|nr:isoleucine--tRNA ligase [Lachnospiraceae bacterium NSJ-143]
MYNKVSTNLDFVEREKEVLKFWRDNEIFKKTFTQREGCPKWTFYDGPPTANGRPHIGHVITRSVKDIICRYHVMKGEDVFRKAGWDTHGLPVELEVEKMLGLDGKPQIEEYGVEPFIKQCKESVWKYLSEWTEMSDRLGFWADMENPYITYHNNYIESEWWALKQIWDKGLLYKGHKIVPYCPRCGTALSSHEVAQGYKDVKETSAIAKFRLRDEDTFVLAWTTTPWTLPSNVGLCMNPDEAYVKVKANGEQYILAEALVKTVLGEETEFEVIERKKGSEYAGLRYYPLFDFIDDDDKGFKVVADNYVTLTEGTGVVHIATAFGEDDARVGTANGLPFRQYVDTQGNFTSEVKPWAGVFVKDGDKMVLDYLKENGRLFAALKFEHSYPFCWRCDTPLLYYAREEWFIKMTAVRDQLVANNRSINWLPDNIKEGRMGNFLENVIDWGLSRERYWGTPLPVWECECGHRHVIGSIEELKSMSDDCPDEIELHKPYIDRVHIKCPECGKPMTRVSEVIDCWFDSGAMPFAQFHYPFENREVFESRFPADYITEAIDQTRGWFYSQLAIATVLFGQSDFKNCIVMGHVQDKNGLKMSKHKGNVVSPWDILDKQGSDAIRWFFFVNSAPWLPCRFDEEQVNETQRKFLGTLWNTYAFYVLYAEIDQFNPMDYKLEYNKLPAIDKWILSRLNTLVKETRENLDNFRITEPARALNSFVDELSNWYVRRSRERFWAKGMEQDKINAYMTLYTVLTTLSRVAAPFVPYMTEEIYQNLVVNFDKSACESIHLTLFPEYDESMIDTELEKNMETVLEIVVNGRAARNSANIKNRQPIGVMYVKCAEELPKMYVDIIAEELNVKEVKFTTSTDGLTGYNMKPQLRTLGPKYGKLVPKIKEYLADADGSEIVPKLRNGETITFAIDGTEVSLTEADVLVEVTEKSGFVTEADARLAVVLDTNLTPELIEEGFVREIVSKVQTMRKEAGFEVMDRIRLGCKGNSRIADVITRNENEIRKDVLANDFADGALSGYEKEWNINGETVTLSVEKL